jgi:hypothetical protein
VTERFWSATEAFGHFATKPRNIRWSWSACSDDGNTVVLTWWKDEINRDSDGKLVFDRRNHVRLPLWQHRLGNRERIRNLVHCRDHCGGLFRIVWQKAADPDAPTRRAVERYPDDALWMRLIELNEQTGELLAKEVDHA